MQSSYLITAITFSVLDLGYQVHVPTPQVIGAAIFTGHVEQGRIHFALDTAVLSAQDPAGTLLAWLDRRLECHDTTLAGFDLDRHVPLLRGAPRARQSTAIRALTGRDRIVIDMRASEDGKVVPFTSCCAALGIPYASADPVRDFTAWCTGDAGEIPDNLELDVIAVWRLAMYQLAARVSDGPQFHQAMNANLAAWLRDADFPAAAAHLATLMPADH